MKCEKHNADWMRPIAYSAPEIITPWTWAELEGPCRPKTLFLDTLSISWCLNYDAFHKHRARFI